MAETVEVERASATAAGERASAAETAEEEVKRAFGQ